MAKAPRKKGSARKAPATRTKTRSRPTRRPSGGSGSGYDIICSECYSTFSMTNNPGDGRLICPECMHAGEIAEKDVMTKIAIAKSAERSNFIKAAIPAVLFFVVGLAYIGVLTSQEEVSQGLNLGLLGVGGLLFIAAVGMAFKYEGNRHDVYF